MRSHLLAATALTTAAAVATPARAGLSVTQSVDAAVDGKVTHSRHVWLIDKGRFLLTVTADRGETRYLFNGKTFYVCGKLDPQQLAPLTKANGQDGKAFDRFKAGACQVVPSNFMVRFFLSPMAAVESVDATDGLKLTLDLSGYSLKNGGTGATVAGKPCTPLARQYVLTKTEGDSKGQAAAVTVHEDFCQDKSLGWRDTLWTEVAKAVMRQPGGGALLKGLKQDAGNLPGLMLRAESHQELLDRSGKKHTLAFNLTTSAVKPDDPSDRRFKTPEGYALFSPEDMELAHGGAPTAKTGLAAAAAGVGADDGVLQSAAMVFCALAGGISCAAGVGISAGD